MGNTLTTFRNGFFGVRPNRFLVEAAFPQSGVDISTAYIYIKAADIPGANIGTIPVAWQGRVIKFSGERAYSDWSIQCYESNVKAKDLRDAFEGWAELLDGRNSHSINYDVTQDWIIRWSDIISGTSDSAGDTDSQDISDFNKAIRLKNCWPVDIGAMPFNYDVSDSFSEFTVTMAYDYWEPID